MHDFVGVGDVVSNDRLAWLSRRSDRLGLCQLASHLGALALCSYGLFLTWGSTWWAAPLFFSQGVLINFLFACQHETNHNTAFSTRWLNTWVSRLCGFVLLYPADYEKWLHFAHHRHTQVDGKDPELLMRPPFERPGQYLALMSGLPFFYGRIRSLVRHAAGHVEGWYLTEDQKRLITKSTRWHLVGYATITLSAAWFESWWPLIYWLGPYMCTKWVYWIQGIQEHLGLTHRNNTLLNTRTSEASAIMRWLNWNMTYHTVHHTFPAVPFHALSKLHQEVTATYEHALPSSSYWSFHYQLLRSLIAGKTEQALVGESDQQLLDARPHRGPARAQP